MNATPPKVQTAEVQAGDYWAETKVRVQRGHAYAVTVNFPPPDSPDAVKDWFLKINDLGGWPTWAQALGTPFFFMRRSPIKPWFALMATVERRDVQRLYPDTTYHPRATGRLVCYFNDSPWAYRNNSGKVSLKVTDLGPVKK